MRYKIAAVLFLTFFHMFEDCHTNSGTDRTMSNGEIPIYTYEVVNSWPHDPEAFTQGLIFQDGVLYESTGLNGASSLRKVALETGKVLQKVDVPKQFFAEGMTIFQGK